MEETFAEDLLIGAGNIAEFMLGDRKKRRKVYAMDKEAYGFFYIGKLICARKSTIRERIAAREAGSAA
jgi:hypothetical protein